MKCKNIISGVLLLSLCICLAGCGAGHTGLSDQEVHPIGSELSDTGDTSENTE